MKFNSPRFSWKFSIGLVTLCISLIAFTARAQQATDCSDAVKKALSTTGDKCASMGRNKACYGNALIMAIAKDGVQPSDFTFQNPGDTVDVSNVSSLRLGALDSTAQTWGVAYMRIQANLPDTAAGQYVTMLMFGNTQIQDASQTVSTASTTYKPMQAVYFKTGIGSPACHAAPTSGLIIQSPKGTQKVDLVVNQVKMSIGSTVFIQAPADDLAPLLNGSQTPTSTVPPTNTPRFGSQPTPIPQNMTITTIEGEAVITALGQTETIKTGQQLNIPMDPQNNHPVGVLPSVVAVAPDALVALNVQSSVNNTLLIPTDTPTDQIVGTAAVTAAVTDTVPALGFLSSLTPSKTPRPPTRTPLPSNTPLPTAIPPTSTPIPPPTITLTPSNTPIPSNTPPPTATNTPTLTPSNTPIPLPIVTNLNDSGPGSLRGMILSVPPGTTITFAVTGTITLTSGEILINKALTLQGPNARSLVISGNGASRIFSVAGVNVSMSGLTLSNSNASGNGGAINQTGGSLNLSNVAITASHANGSGGCVSALGTLIITNSTFQNSTAVSGGCLATSGSTNIANSTIASNTTSGGTGGGIYNTGTLTVINSTLSGNSAAAGGGIVDLGTLYLGGSILTNNTAASGPNIAGAVQSQGYNLIANTAGISGGLVASDIQNIPANLSGLANNGGETDTFMPNAGSPAIDAIPNGTCFQPRDQRGNGRPNPAGGACNIGSVER